MEEEERRGDTGKKRNAIRDEGKTANLGFRVRLLYWGEGEGRRGRKRIISVAEDQFHHHHQHPKKKKNSTTSNFPDASPFLFLFNSFFLSNMLIESAPKLSNAITQISLSPGGQLRRIKRKKEKKRKGKKKQFGLQFPGPKWKGENFSKNFVQKCTYSSTSLFATT